MYPYTIIKTIKGNLRPIFKIPFNCLYKLEPFYNKCQSCDDEKWKKIEKFMQKNNEQECKVSFEYISSIHE